MYSCVLGTAIRMDTGGEIFLFKHDLTFKWTQAKVQERIPLLHAAHSVIILFFFFFKTLFCSISLKKKNAS